ncbi:MAG: hypothetical protein IPO39_17400 [Bacteroidetes bacterium]|nr:hypothetical protein [Bacteroidota bacterium]
MSSCSVSNGALHCEFTPAQSNPVSFVWNTGERSSYIRNLYPGTYSVISTINDVACSYFASYSLGTAPLNGPLVTAQVIRSPWRKQRLDTPKFKRGKSSVFFCLEKYTDRFSAQSFRSESK